jgi:beta-lactamase regulating signal transducer with metallopeptidase domain
MAGADLALLLLKHSATVALLLLALRLLQGASAARRVFAARCGLVALLLMPLFWLALPQLPVRAPLAVSALLDPPLLIPATVTMADVPALAEALAAPARAAQLGRWLLAVYAAGVLCHLLRLALNLRRLGQVAAAARPLESTAWNACLQRRQLLSGVRRPVRLLVSVTAASPYSWGLLHPVIVLDRHSADSADPDAVLAHELAHIRSGDWPVLLLARVLLALYWWHPLMSLLVRAYEHDTECAADDAVLASGAKPSHYAHTLLTVSRHAFGTGAADSLANRIASRGAMLAARVTALLQAHRPRGRVTAGQWWGGALATLALVGMIGSLKLRGEQVLWPDSLLAPTGSSGQHAMQLLAASGNPNFVQLAAAMRAGDFKLRHAAEIKSVRQRAAIPALLLALRDERPVVRQLAVWGLGEMRFPETAPAVAALLADPDAAVRAEAAGALGDMDETRWLGPMIAMLGDGDASVRSRVAHALGDLRAAASRPMLESRLNDPEPKVVSEVRWALGEMQISPDWM